uniref:hypothetical chloroplast RF19 n=1 Tax=Saxifraga balfourii TaxID=489506 RepID=UPI0022FD458B|nr:hypothetical chloroplast RF19 [Saxifraga balfourii]WBQ49629.1 hypothetical chloroplast RF19 [Saxifraga balfourii]
MIFKSFLLGNLVSLCMKIINSVVVVGLYYGFLTTFSIGPSYLFLLRAQVMEEGTQKKVSATTGFITGQLMMFISIYYAPLHLALGRPHTITVLALPYLLFHFFWNNHKYFFDYGSTTRNSMRNLSIQCVFLNNLIFQLFNHFILPSSMLARLVNIYMFRCNNKILFVTSSFVGWLIGHILFMKWVGLVLVWIRQNHSIRSIVLIRSNKYLVSEVINSRARIISILLLITCVYYLGRIPSPILTTKLPETSETEETDVEIETTSERKGTKEEQEGSTEEDPSPSLFSEEKEDPDKIDETEEIRVNGTEKTKDEFHFHFKETCYNNSPVSETSDLDGNQENSKLEILKNKEKEAIFFWFEKPLVTRLFDYKRWNRPLRYIKNDQFEKAIRNETSQYIFYTCRSDGNQRIAFTYPSSLSTFLEMIQRKMTLYTNTMENHFSYELYNQWGHTKDQKEKNLSNEFLSRLQAIDKGSLPIDVIKKRKKLCNNNKIKKAYLPKKYDPLLTGPYRGTIAFLFSPSIENYMGTLWINKIHGMLFTTNTDYVEFDQKMDMDAFDKKSLSTEIEPFFNFISKFNTESPSYLNVKRLSLFLFLEKKKNYSKFLKFLFNAVLTDTNDQTIRKKYLGVSIKEIRKKIPRWSYKLINDLEHEEKANNEGLAEDPQIRSRKAKLIIIFNDNQNNLDNTLDIYNSNQTEEVTLLRYSEQSDFRREIIKGSMRAQRRKMVISKQVQANAHSPLFMDRIESPLFFAFDISKLMKFIFITRMGKNTEFKISDYVGEAKKKNDKLRVDKSYKHKMQEKAQIETAEIWDTILLGQVIRSSLLLTQAILRKYIILPSFIIAKNLGRLLLFDFPEWSEDLTDWKKERHVKCTYNGVQLADNEFPTNWLTEGIQIKILFPFRLKPWHRSNPDSSYREKKSKKYDFCFLTVWGVETDLPFCSPRKRSSFFAPILKELGKMLIKRKTNCFPILRRLNDRTNFSLKVSTTIKKSILLIKKIIKELAKINPKLLFGLGEVYELRETKKETDFIISNSIISKPSSKIKSIDWRSYSLPEKKTKELTDRTSLIITQINKLRKAKKNKNLTSEKNISSNKKSNDANRLESYIFFFQVLKRIKIRLIRKSHFFIQFFFQRIYFLGMINILRIDTQVFLESTTKKVKKYIYNINIKANPERIEKKKKKKIHFRKSLSNISNINKYSKNLPSLSQAYVFYKLSKTHVINLRSVLQYHGTPVFKKNELTGYFRTQEIFRSELKNKKLRNSRLNPWKNWLRVHYQYNLSKIQWSKLVAQKWQNTVNQAPQKELNKWYSYEKETYSLLPNTKENFKRHSEYDLLSSKSINYEAKRNSYSYVSSLQVNNTEEISYNYNIDKQKLFDGLAIILIKNYLGKDAIMAKNPDRKYADWKIIHFSVRKKLNSEAWIHSTSNKQTSHDQKVDKMYKKYPFYLSIHEDINPFKKKKKQFAWMGMNEEIQNKAISDFELWFFPEIMLLYNSYKIKPWVIPIKLLFFFFQGNAPSSTNKNITEKKYLEEDYTGSVIKNHTKKKQNTSAPETEFDFFLKNNLLILFRSDYFFNQQLINNIKVYCLLLRLRSPRKVFISSLQRGEMIFNIMLSHKDVYIPELVKGWGVSIEPVRLSVKTNGKFIRYQSISISLVQKSKDRINQRYGDKKNFYKSLTRHHGNRDKNYYALLVPENILSPRRRREFRIVISLNSRKGKGVDRNPILWDGKNVKNCVKFLDTSPNLDIDKNKLIKLKFFLWPTYRLEDLACMNRYWFDTTNSSSFSVLRLHMYPQYPQF